MMNISISQDLIKPFEEATRNIYSTMLGIELSRTGQFISQDHDVKYDVSGTMGITGDVTGNIAISFPYHLACRVVSMLLGDEITEYNEMVADGVGEMINMVTGDAKRIFEERKVNFEIALPQIIEGQGHKISCNSSVPHIILQFETADKEPFAIQIAVKTD
jgi:chemotaxis protein CheX